MAHSYFTSFCAVLSLSLFNVHDALLKECVALKCEETMRISPRWWWWERGSGLAAAQPAACSAVLLLLASLSKPPELEPRPSSSASESSGSCVIELGGSSEEWGEVFVGVEESRRGWGRFFSFVGARN